MRLITAKAQGRSAVMTNKQGPQGREQRCRAVGPRNWGLGQAIVQERRAL
jgi:hypothetical protein